MFEMNNEDKELEEIFHGEDKPLHPNTIHTTIGGSAKPVAKTKQSNPVKNAHEESKAVDAQWEPAKPAPNWLDNLKACAKGVGLFAGLSALLFYWQQTGQMETSAAFPSMLVCFALAGFSVGKIAARGKH